MEKAGPIFGFRHL